MNLLDEIVKAAVDGAKEKRPIAWGQVTAVTPTEVRFVGDTADTEVTLTLSGYTPTTGDTVILLKVGTSWVIIGEVVSA